MNVLEVENVYKHYGEYTALENVSLAVKEQSVFGLLGPNGAGKTSLIRIINQITAPDSGKLTFMGELMESKHVAYIGYLPEERGLYRKMKVGEQAIYLAMLKGLDKQTAEKRLKQWFEKFDITSWWNKKVEELSKGMQQKIQFIVTVIHEPKFLIFDEPFSGFDPINVNLLKDEMLALKKNGASIIFSTHNMASVEELCDDIALINKSKKILDGNIADIKNMYKENIFEIVYLKTETNIADILGNICSILDTSTTKDKICAKIKLMEGKSNDLIAKLLPYISICEFKEILPSMEDVFIRQVKDDSLQ